MNLRQLLPLRNPFAPGSRLQMRSDAFGGYSSWTLKKELGLADQVLLVTSQPRRYKHSNPRRRLLLCKAFDNVERRDSQSNANFSTVAFTGNTGGEAMEGVRLAPSAHQIEQAPPALVPKPQKQVSLSLRERLQIARRRRFQEYKPAPASAPSTFDRIMADRLAAPKPPVEEKETLSPLVKAIFDILDQTPAASAPDGVVSNELQDDDIKLHRKKHKYRVYSQAFNTGDPRFDSLGRTLCRILRHQAADLGLAIRSDGYVRMEDILSLSIRTHAGFRMKEHSLEEVLKVVAEDPKQRYSTMVEDGYLYIRANQGHSMKVVKSDHLLTQICAPDEVPICVHGTYKCFLPSIMNTGLSRMNRNHVHFAIGLPNDEGVISGMLDSVDVLIYLDVAKALQGGMDLYISDNKVVLTEGFDGIVPCEYFNKVLEWPSFNPLV